MPDDYKLAWFVLKHLIDNILPLTEMGKELEHLNKQADSCIICNKRFENGEHLLSTPGWYPETDKMKLAHIKCVLDKIQKDDDSCHKNGIDCKYIGTGRYIAPCEECRIAWYDTGNSPNYEPDKSKKDPFKLIVPDNLTWEDIAQENPTHTEKPVIIPSPNFKKHDNCDDCGWTKSCVSRYDHETILCCECKLKRRIVTAFEPLINSKPLFGGVGAGQLAIDFYRKMLSKKLEDIKKGVI